MSEQKENKEHHLIQGVQMTLSAYQKVKELIIDTGEPATALRIYIQGGGCAGFEYGFQFDAQIGDQEWLSLSQVNEVGEIQTDSNWVQDWPQPLQIESGPEFSGEKVYIVIDPYSYPLINGSLLDYVNDDPTGRRFIFKNPRAKRTCGCGSSFEA